MANTDRPNGMYPWGHMICGCCPALSPLVHKIADQYNTALFRGQPISINNAGNVIAAGASGGRIMGAFWGVEYVNAAGDQIIDNHWVASTDATGDVVAKVYLDPFIIYQIQASGSIVEADVGLNADTTAEAGSASNGTSTVELDSDTEAVTAALQLRIWGKVDDPENAWGTNVKLLVTVNEHCFWGAQDFTGL